MSIQPLCQSLLLHGLCAATEHLLWTTYSLSNSIAVSKAMICSWSFLRVLHNAFEIAQQSRGKPFELSGGRSPDYQKKVTLQMDSNSSCFLKEGTSSIPFRWGSDTQISYFTAHFHKGILFEISLAIKWHRLPNICGWMKEEDLT